jgi:hypothetical protein
MGLAIVAAVAALIAAAVLFFYFRAVKAARKARAEIKAGLGEGKCVLFFNATKLTLNGLDVSGMRLVGTRRERGVLLDPGRYDCVGTFSARDDDGKPIATFSGAALAFTLKPAKQYELGIYLFDTEIQGSAEAFLQLGPSGSGQGMLALACVIL